MSRTTHFQPTTVTRHAMLAARATTTPRLAISLARGFSSTPIANARRDRGENNPFTNLNGPEMKYRFDDTTSLGHRLLIDVEEARSLLSRSVKDTEILAARARKFPYNPPTGTLRIISQVDLGDPESAYNFKRVMIAPVASLPLKGPDAIQRFKVLAGPRWTPGPPGRGEMGTKAAHGLPSVAEEDKLGKDGYIKIAEERYPEPNMNRKSLNDMLVRLVEAANDPKSPLPANTPVDMRHLLARQAKKKQRTQSVHARKQALEARKQVVGGVRGFPVEWLSADAQAKLAEGGKAGKA